MNNAILCLLHSLKYEDILPFLQSLKNTTYDGDIILFCYNVHQDLKLQVKEFGKYKVNNITPITPKYRYIDGSNVRYFQYAKFLKANCDKYDNIFLMDMRDVIFQRDPFDFDISGKLNVFLEDHLISNCEFNKKWILSAYSKNMLNRLGDKRVCCSGTVVGPIEVIRQYVSDMCSEFAEIARDNPLKLTIRGLDQGAHNKLIHIKYPKDDMIIHDNYNGPVMTMGTMPDENIKFNEDFQIINDFGVVNTIHQYDRKPKIFQNINTHLASRKNT